MVFVLDKEYNIKGLVSDYESWILANIAKNQKIFLNLELVAEKQLFLWP